jgi:hypothetical protein
MHCHKGAETVQGTCHREREHASGTETKRKRKGSGVTLPSRSGPRESAGDCRAPPVAPVPAMLSRSASVVYSRIAILKETNGAEREAMKTRPHANKDHTCLSRLW